MNGGSGKAGMSKRSTEAQRRLMADDARRDRERRDRRRGRAHSQRGGLLLLGLLLLALLLVVILLLASGCGSGEEPVSGSEPDQGRVDGEGLPAQISIVGYGEVIEATSEDDHNPGSDIRHRDRDLIDPHGERARHELNGELETMRGVTVYGPTAGATFEPRSLQVLDVWSYQNWREETDDPLTRLLFDRLPAEHQGEAEFEGRTVEVWTAELTFDLAPAEESLTLSVRSYVDPDTGFRLRDEWTAYPTGDEGALDWRVLELTPELDQLLEPDHVDAEAQTLREERRRLIAGLSFEVYELPPEYLDLKLVRMLPVGDWQGVELHYASASGVSDVGFLAEETVVLHSLSPDLFPNYPEPPHDLQGFWMVAEGEKLEHGSIGETGVSIRLRTEVASAEPGELRQALVVFGGEGPGEKPASTAPPPVDQPSDPYLRPHEVGERVLALVPESGLQVKKATFAPLAAAGPRLSEIELSPPGALRASVTIRLQWHIPERNLESIVRGLGYEPTTLTGAIDAVRREDTHSFQLIALSPGRTTVNLSGPGPENAEENGGLDEAHMRKMVEEILVMLQAKG